MRSFTIVAVAAAMAGLSFAADNDKSSGDSVELFIEDGLGGQGQYAASIVDACRDHTVYAIQCTSARGIPDSICGDAAPTLTLTEGPTLYSVDYTTETRLYGHDVEISVEESCSINLEETSAFCVASLTVSADGQSTSSATSTTLTGTDFHRYDVAITGGAEKTASATGACTADNKDSAAAAGTSANSVRVIGAALAVGLVAVIAL